MNCFTRDRLTPRISAASVTVFTLLPPCRYSTVDATVFLAGFPASKTLAASMVAAGLGNSFRKLCLKVLQLVNRLL